jgi:hypothetical protein
LPLFFLSFFFFAMAYPPLPAVPPSDTARTSPR